MLSKDILGIYEAYSKMYQPTNPPEGVVEEEIDGLVEEVIGELFEECIEEGYTIDEASDAIEEAATEYLMELNPYAPAGSKAAKAYAKSTTATKRGVERKAAVKGAVERVKAKAKGAKAAAGIAGSIAKDEARRAGRAAKQAVAGAVEKKKKEVKSGIKGFLGKAAKKVASKASSVAARLGEEAIQEDSRRMSNKQKTASVRQNIKAFGSNFTPPNNYDPDANRGKGEVLTRKQIEKKRRKSLRQEEFDLFEALEALEASGLFSEKEIEAILEVEMSEGYKEIDAKKHGRMYDRYKKLRTAAMKDAEESGEASGENRRKMGRMQGVISKSAENLRNKG